MDGWKVVSNDVIDFNSMLSGGGAGRPIKTTTAVKLMRMDVVQF